MCRALCAVILVVVLVVGECLATADGKDQETGALKTEQGESTNIEKGTDSDENSIKATDGMSELEKTKTDGVVKGITSESDPAAGDTDAALTTPTRSISDRPADVSSSNLPQTDGMTTTESSEGIGGTGSEALLEKRKQNADTNDGISAPTDNQTTPRKAPDEQGVGKGQSHPPGIQNEDTEPERPLRNSHGDTSHTVSVHSPRIGTLTPVTEPKETPAKSERPDKSDPTRNAVTIPIEKHITEIAPHDQISAQQYAPHVQGHTVSPFHINDLIKGKEKNEIVHGTNPLPEDHGKIRDPSHIRNIKDSTSKTKNDTAITSTHETMDTAETTPDSTITKVTLTGTNSNVDTMASTKRAKDISSSTDAKEAFRAPNKSLPTVSNALPLHNSVDKTDGILCSSSLFALAALATLAVAAAAPAH